MQRALAALALAGLTSQPVLAQAMPDDAAIKTIISDRIEQDAGDYAIAVAVIENGKARFVSHGSWGEAGETPVDETTLFEAGSITKVLTNVLLARLVVDGKMALDAPLVDYLPEGVVLPERDGKALTALDLSTHTSGLTGLPPALLERGLDNPYSGFDAEALLDYLAGAELARPIGEAFEYSNLGTALLALAIEHVTGEDYAALVQTKIFDPLGMNQSYLAMTGSPLPPMAQGYDAAGDAVAYWDFAAFAPAGALVTNASDLAKFVAAASGAVDSPLSDAFAIMMDETRPLDGADSRIGLGWFELKRGDSAIVWHNGRTAGFNAIAGFDDESRNGVVVLANRATHTGIEDIGLHLLDADLPLRVPSEPREVAVVDPAIFDGYVGDYLLAPGIVVSITTEGQKLYAQLSGQPRYEIFPESEARFFFRIVDAQITFAVDDAGATGALMLHQNGQNLTAMRIK